MLATARPLLVAAGVLLAVTAAMLVVRWPLYVEPGILLGWNSDTAIYGLMARTMVAEGRPILLFWGQDYLGTLTSLWTVAASPFTGGVTPLALRLGAALQVAVALALFWRVLLRAWGPGPAAVTVLWLIAGPRWFFEMTYAPLSAEQMFLTGALILWYADRKPFTTARQWFVLGVLIGLGWWAHRGSLFAAVPAIVMVAARDRALWNGWTRILTAATACLTGLILGCLPWAVGRFQSDQRLYEPVSAPWSVFRLFDRIGDVARVDLWAFLGADSGPLGWVCGALLLSLIVIGSFSALANRTAALLIGVAVVAATFWLFSPQAYSGATRYLMLALPVAYALAARGIVTLASGKRVMAKAAALAAFAIVTVNLYVARHADVSEIVAARREDHYQWRSFDPRPALREIERGRYAVCYADFWAAYKLEFLSSTGVQFIPYRSVNRTQRRSLLLAGSPGQKCFVDRNGRVRRVDPVEETLLRANVLRSTKGTSVTPVRPAE